jgi:AraC family ethanolamine operon transcriptional activator
MMREEHFEDFDAFAASVRDLDCTMMLQNPARRSWIGSVADISGIRVQMGRLGSGNIVEGQSWVDGSMIYLPLTATCEYSANGRVIEKDAFMVLGPGTDFVLSTKFEHDWCSISVPSQVLELDLDFQEPLKASDETGCRVTRPNRHLAGQFETSVRQVLATAAQYPQFESSPGATVAAADLLELGALVLGRQQRSTPDAGRFKVSRVEIIRRSKELLEQREGEHVSIAELAAAAGVSERTLRTAFHEAFGVGPTRYLQLRSLHQIERALRAAHPEETTVAEVLARHGVWQFGRCAARYQRLFGELPSETLLARRR